MIKKLQRILYALLAAAVGLTLAGLLLVYLLFGTGIQMSQVQKESTLIPVVDRFHTELTNRFSASLEGILDIKKIYWLSDDDLVAPEPNQANFGTTTDPSTLGWLLEEAQELLDGQKILFSTDVVLPPDTEVTYYLDETIFAVTWKQAINDTMYTMSEVKIAHPSQFRRFLSGGSFGSGIQLKASEMAGSVNAVVASSGDFYAHRRMGISVYNGLVHRVKSEYLDTCYIDENGDMLFSYRKELKTVEEAQQFVDANSIRFSLAFGPALILDGQKLKLSEYAIGDIPEPHCRAALCQMDQLHYLLVTAGIENDCGKMINIYTFQDVLMSFGCDKAYNLDGGQTAVLIMNDTVMNRVSYNEERDVSDIIYFATALPNGK